MAVFLVAAATGAPGDAMRPPQTDPEIDRMTALAPVTVAASGVGRLSGMATGRDGGVLVTDREDGTLSRIATGGDPVVLVRGLDRPEAVAVTAAGDMLVMESGSGRILRVGPDNAISVVIGGLHRPRAIAVSPDGDVWVASHQRSGVAVGRIDPSGALTVLISGLADVTALAAEGDAVIIATHNAVLRVAAGGRAPDVLVPGWRATSMAVDVLGDLYLAGRALGSGDAGGIVKYHRASGALTEFAAPFRLAGLLALEESGSLLAFSTGSGGRIIRFTAPRPPVLDLPEYTNRLSLLVSGAAERGSRVQLLVDRNLQATAEGETGRFMLEATVLPNAATTLAFVATGGGGRGLTSRAAAATVVHDDRHPIVAISEPATAAHARTAVALAATADDEGSGVGRLRFLLDDLLIGETESAGVDRSVSGRTVADVTGILEGMHTLTAYAEDRAGNHAAAAQLLVVDRTPPETMLVQHPPAETALRDVTFAFEGTDVHSPALEYSWRLDSGGWSPYSGTATIVAERLGAGPHVFEVRARDLAGNDDPTPARWAFSVQSLTLTVIEPAREAVLNTSTVWVRGEAQGTPPLVVSVPLAPEFQAVATAVHAPVVGGTFAVEVPIVATASALAVTAVDGTGASVTETVAIQVTDTASAARSVPASPAAGFAPHSVQFGVMSLPPGTYAVDLESDGTADVVGPKPDGRAFTYAAPGVFVATLSTVGADGIAARWRSAVRVYDRASLEIELRGVWSGIKEALAAGEPDVAASFVHSARRPVWRDAFIQLLSAGPVDAGGMFTDIAVLGFEGDHVECEMMRAVDGLMYSFPVTFTMDTDGRWRLWQF